MKYYLIAGEASGDLHASNLMKELLIRDNEAAFRYWGGDLMKQCGGTLVKHYRDLAFMGFLEVLLNLKTILKNLKFCKEDILSFHPDVVILIDYPGFILKVAEFVHSAGIPVFYYISPQLWAWNKSRVHKVKRYVDRMFVILPFEKAFYEKYNYAVDFVGHPLLDVINSGDRTGEGQAFRSKNGLDQRPLIALLPGSRKQEISMMLKVMLRLIPDFPDHQFVIAGAPSQSREFYQKITKGNKVLFVTGQTYDLLRCADAALVTSGTATLETALMSVPQVVCYKGNFFSYQIARMVVDVKCISLVNLIMERMVVKELIQNNMNRKNLKEELIKLLQDRAYRSAMIESYQSLRKVLGKEGASAKTAALIIQYLKQNKV